MSVWVGEHLLIVVDRGAVDLVVSTVYLGVQRIAVRHALPVGRKTRVFAPFRVAQRVGAAYPDRLSGSPDHQIAVLGPHALVGCSLDHELKPIAVSSNRAALPVRWRS